MLFEKQKKIVFIGDSITDSGRRDVAIPYGNGYVSIVRTFLIARYPDYNLNIVNKGISGNTVRDLAGRWEADAIAEQPHYLSVCIGINDVWRQFSNDPTAVYPEEYQTTYRRLLQRAKDATAAKFIVMSPYKIEADRTEAMRKQIDAYTLIAKGLAKDFGATFVDVQAAFDAALRATTPESWSTDQFHPNGPGATVIAHAFLKAIGFEL